jgi:16S rRNA (guanine(966)-N(2))-methyltransferase RsmD
MIVSVGKHRAQKVRVIAGEYKGRRLAYPDTGAIRPTMDRTREALFSAIHDRITGCVFVDLFSAGGVVGIEALSRGASMVHFVEQLPEAVECLRRNLNACNVASDRYRVHAADVFAFLDRGGLESDLDTIVFADPPYGYDKAADLLSHFDKKGYNNVLLFILEHRQIIDTTKLGSLIRSNSKRYGDTILTFWARQ